VVTLTGPRQSGKTTLVRSAFSNLPYVSLEDPDIRQVALTDPRGFLSNYSAGAVLDEIQNTPDLFSYLQRIVDENRQVQLRPDRLIELLVDGKISQTLWRGAPQCCTCSPFSFG